MPAQTVTDWSVVRASWAAIGSFSETAKAHGLNPDAVRQRAKREGWQAARNAVTKAVTESGKTVTAPTVLSRIVTPAHAVITDELSQRGANSRLNAARIADNSLAEIAAMEPERMIAALEAANQAGSLAQKGNVPGWERQPQSTENHSHLHLHQHLRPDQTAP